MPASQSPLLAAHSARILAIPHRVANNVYQYLVVTKRDQKMGGQRTSFNNNRGGDGVVAAAGATAAKVGLNTATARAEVRPTVGTSPLAPGTTSVWVRTSLIIARAVCTPRMRQPQMISCTSATSALPTAISAKDVLRLLPRDRAAPIAGAFPYISCTGQSVRREQTAVDVRHFSFLFQAA